MNFHREAKLLQNHFLRVCKETLAGLKRNVELLSSHLAVFRDKPAVELGRLMAEINRLFFNHEVPLPAYLIHCRRGVKIFLW